MVGPSDVAATTRRRRAVDSCGTSLDLMGVDLGVAQSARMGLLKVRGRADSSSKQLNKLL